MYVRRYFPQALPSLEALRELASKVDLTKGSASYISSSEETLPIVQPAFPFLKLLRAGIIVLQPSQQLVAHVDAWDPAWIRLHIPLYTNADCWSYHLGAWQRLDEGEIYEMSPAEVHGAVNWGTTPRVHLMLDYMEELC